MVGQIIPVAHKPLIHIDHIVPIQVFDLTMWENLFCSILDSLVAIVEPKGKKQSAWKLELMNGPIEIGTSKKNMLKIETQMYQDVRLQFFI